MPKVKLLVFYVCCGTINSRSNQSKEFECIMEFSLIHFNVLIFWSFGKRTVVLEVYIISRIIRIISCAWCFMLIPLLLFEDSKTKLNVHPPNIASFMFAWV